MEWWVEVFMKMDDYGQSFPIQVPRVKEEPMDEDAVLSQSKRLEYARAIMGFSSQGWIRIKTEEGEVGHHYWLGLGQLITPLSV
jgi:hypothetical protein